MPSPVGHTLAGVSLHLFTRRAAEPQLLRAFGLITVANLPDVDFIAGYLVGQPSVFHWGPTHSFAAAILFAAATGLIATRWQHKFKHVFWLVLAAYLSHIVLDVLTGRAEVSSVGLQLFWPFSSAHYLANVPVFLMAPHSINYAGPLRTLFSREMLPIIGRELVILLPLATVIWLWVARRTRAAG